MRFVISAEAMAGIMRRYQWRLVLADMSRNLVKTPFDEHYFAVSAYGPYPKDTLKMGFRTVAKMLRRSPSEVQFHAVEHRELVLVDGVCPMCRFASSVLKRELEREREEAEGEEILAAARNGSPRMTVKAAQPRR